MLTMASVLAGTIPWHDGEEKMHRLLRVPDMDNPAVPYLSANGGYFLTKAPLLAVGTIDAQGRPWTSLWGGKEGFAAPIAESMIGLRTQVDSTYDPVVKELLGSQAIDNTGAPLQSPGNMISGLAIHLEHRRRWKLFGRMVAGSLDGDQGQAQLVVKIEESLGNCPKYLNKKHIVSVRPNPTLISDLPQLPAPAIELLSRADTIFVSSRHGTSDMDTNIRGGPPGFVRVESNDANAVLVYPEYSGNRLYQTLGNLQTTPLAGYVFPDFETGNVLYVTGHTEILVGQAAAAILPRSNLAVRVTVTAAFFVEKGLAFRGEAGEPSPYNPAVRYLTTEKSIPTEGERDAEMTATLINKEKITPNIYRFRFRYSSPRPISWTPGQYATLSFQDELDMGYSHMRDDDPASLNDDYVRTFTVSSYPGRELPANEFEMTIRRHGNVTNHLFRINERAGLEVPLKGFGGSFQVSTDNGSIVPFVAGGIGITPLLAQLPALNLPLVRLFWSVSIADIGLVHDTFQRWPELSRSTVVFVTGLDPDRLHQIKLDAIHLSGARVVRRRMQAGDLDPLLAETWYLCAGDALKRMVLGLLTGKRVVYEDFNY
ncbi:Riboflavin synthase-like beta-barrel [Penicillium cinerascens]|uniref:Riboflavin synthase-like beta-barrel n=1 Tax=Penicillium cinerascens TaxID=70096 RepID=A0A9W9NA95_9EURO|nr:Riboflavin synthase-like beta-barrel [Penicillium cinerascens]KAJ5216076.1 Riboflavin synthase-like beta-barrel [Penicillium cinerascens]